MQLHIQTFHLKYKYKLGNSQKLDAMSHTLLTGADMVLSTIPLHFSPVSSSSSTASSPFSAQSLQFSPVLSSPFSAVISLPFSPVLSSPFSTVISLQLFLPGSLTFSSVSLQFSVILSDPMNANLGRYYKRQKSRKKFTTNLSCF